MHELSVAMEVVDRAVSCAEGARIRSIFLEVGELACVLPEALRFCFDVVAEGTVAAGAELRISTAKAVAHCQDCQRNFEPSRPHVTASGSCSCGSQNLTLLGGRELQIVALEMEVQ